MNAVIDQLLRYAVDRDLIEPEDEVWARNALLDALGRPDYAREAPGAERTLAQLLEALTDDAVSRGVKIIAVLAALAVIIALLIHFLG